MPTNMFGTLGDMKSTTLGDFQEWNQSKNLFFVWFSKYWNELNPDLRPKTASRDLPLCGRVPRSSVYLLARGRSRHHASNGVFVDVKLQMILYSQFVCTSHRILKEQSGRRMETPQRSIHKKSSVTTNSYLSSDVTVPDTRPKINYTISRPERLPANLAPSNCEPIVLNISYIWTSRRCSTHSTYWKKPTNQGECETVFLRFSTGKNLTQ